jgi:Zn-dependent M16 (insulinase) family peptidase
MYRKSKIGPNANLMGKTIQRIMDMDERNIITDLLYVLSLFSKNIKKISTGKSRNRKFNRNDSINAGLLSRGLNIQWDHKYTNLYRASFTIAFSN